MAFLPGNVHLSKDLVELRGGAAVCIEQVLVETAQHGLKT